MASTGDKIETTEAAEVIETWKPGMPCDVAIRELEARWRLRQKMGCPERLARQHGAGKLTICERAWVRHV